MKFCFTVLSFIIISFASQAKEATYVGSTPAHSLIRGFLQISLTDSIDFIRWKLEIGSAAFKLTCTYGLAAAGTPGFSNEQNVAFEGKVTEAEDLYRLQHGGRTIFILQVNENILHFLDSSNRMLIGNGGYSFALNNTRQVTVNEFNARPVQKGLEGPLVFEGRTPCNQLSTLLGMTKSEACNKMKWYFILYTDSLSGKPSNFLMGGMGYRKETMAKGNWEIESKGDGRIIYRLHSDKWMRALNLLKGDENILFFIDADGQPLVGNEDFSYTLNRRKEEYPPSGR